MKTAIVTGAAGLIGSESVRFLCDRGFRVIGIDNDMRRYFFGEGASTHWMVERLIAAYPNFHNKNFETHHLEALSKLFEEHSSGIALVLHTAAQPSHDWAAREPLTDFTVNANGTLVLLEMTRRHAPDAPFIFTSTNKVYGDTPNRLPLVELDTRWAVDEDHPFSRHGIDETMSIDATMHSLFG